MGNLGIPQSETLKDIIADSLDQKANGENVFKKDSVWIYFTQAGDTLKVEKYKAGQMISSRQYVEK